MSSRYSVERKYVRYSLDVRAKLSAGEREITVRTLDISEGGVGLISPIEIPEGRSFIVEFEMPAVAGIFRAEVHARSRVGFRFGFSFVGLVSEIPAPLGCSRKGWLRDPELSDRAIFRSNGVGVETATRKWKRIKVDIRVKIRPWDELEAETSVVRTYELSVGGMSVYAAESLPIGTMVRVELSLPATKGGFEIQAVVRNRRGFRLGMEFVDLPETVRAEIQRYLTAEEGVVEIWSALCSTGSEMRRPAESRAMWAHGVVGSWVKMVSQRCGIASR
jgi:c-di-GMP-binding flagellar brake protein YcgR